MSKFIFAEPLEPNNLESSSKLRKTTPSNWTFMSGSFHFSFFGQSDQKMKKSAVIFRQNAGLLYRKQTGQRIYSFLVTLQKIKNEKWNEPDTKHIFKPPPM